MKQTLSKVNNLFSFLMLQVGGKTFFYYLLFLVVKTNMFKFQKQNKYYENRRYYNDWSS